MSQVRNIFLWGALATYLVWFSVEVPTVYGVGVFVLLPALVGFGVTAACRGPRGPRLRRNMLIGHGALAAAAVFMLASGIEGFICLVMATPLASLAVSAGVLFEYLAGSHVDTRKSSWAAAVLLPALFLGEGAVRSDPPVAPVRTEIIVEAPPERVWGHVVAFSELPEPSEFLFRTGVAYPIRAEIDGEGVGAIRRCVFSTGEFVEPITVWRPPSLLAFDVATSPDPMRELSPYEIHPPHLDGYFESVRGQFELIDLGDGRTRLVGTTWRFVDIQPRVYWEAWSDWIIHRIHLRVLGHIKMEAEPMAAL